MVDYAPGLVSGLKAILPTYAEPVEASGTPIPCITWLETDRRDMAAVNRLQYSAIQIRIRVWASSRQELAEYADRTETILRSMGWRMTGGGELSANGRYCKILTCEATGRDNKTW